MNMHYWNQGNFIGLKKIGEQYLSKKGYEAFANYCLFKEKGLKKAALISINEFIRSTKKRGIVEQRKFAEELTSLGFWNDSVHQLIPHPLKQYLLHVLTSWAEEESSNAIPYRWLGYLKGDMSCFERVLEIDPDDEISITRIASAHLNDVNYQTHHLSESIFLGELSEAKSSLEEAAHLIERLEPGDIKKRMLDEHAYYRRLVSCWEEYLIEKTIEPFPNWCKSKGENFKFSTIVYYLK